MGPQQGNSWTLRGQLMLLTARWTDYAEAEEDLTYWQQQCLVAAYRKASITRMIDHLNAKVDLLCSSSLSPSEHTRLAHEVWELTEELTESGVAVCNCCANPRHVRLACLSHRRRAS